MGQKSKLMLGCCAVAMLSALPVAAQDLSGEMQFTWWGGNSRHEKVQTIIGMFQQEHPGVTILPEPQDWGRYWERLNVRAAGGNIPCAIFMLSYNLNEYAGAGLLMDLQPLVDSGAIRTDGIAESILNAGRGPDGALYMLPYGAAPDMLVYNVTLLEEHGIEPLSGTYTWADYFEWMRAAKEKLPEDVYTGEYPSWYPGAIIDYIVGEGHEVFTADGKVAFPREVLIDWWTAWKSLSDDGIVLPPDMLAEMPTAPEMGYVANGGSLTSVRAANGFGAIERNLEALGFTAEAIPVPVGSAGPGDVIPTNGMSIPTTCDNVDTAAAFVDYFTSDPEATSVFSSDNGATTVDALLTRQIEDPNVPDENKKLLEILQQVNERGSHSVAFPTGFQANFVENHRRLSQEVLFGSMSPEQAADAFLAELD